VARQVELANDLGAKEGDDVGALGEQEAGDDLFGDGGTAEDVETLEQPDPTWALEYEHWKGLVARGAEGNLENDRWLGGALRGLARQALGEGA